MQIRQATKEDSDDILEWRNDPVSRSMFFDSDTVTIDEHEKWYGKAIVSPEKTIFLGVEGNRKIGVCRFELLNTNQAEVSINLNPLERGKDLAACLLKMSINAFLHENNVDLIARIKTSNVPSVKIFERVGFKKTNESELEYLYELAEQILEFEVVSGTKRQIDLLYDLLKRRDFNISHTTMPSFEQHRNFVVNNQYVCWYLVLHKKQPIGSFYLQNDNSIGMNLVEIRRQWVSEILRFISGQFTPRPAIASKVPSYFYVNVPYQNKELTKELTEIGLEAIQVSFKM